MVKKIGLIFTLLIFFVVPVYASDELIIKSVEIGSVSEGIEIDNTDGVKIQFNDLGQKITYNVVVQNNSDKILYINGIESESELYDYISYDLVDEYKKIGIEPNAEEKISFYVETLEVDKAGRNFSNEINFKLKGYSVDNPKTSGNIINLILLIVLLLYIFVFVKYRIYKITKFNLVCILFLSIGLFNVYADSEWNINISSDISYKSKNVLETTGASFSMTNSVQRSMAKDIWSYYSKVKNINISSIYDIPDDYLYEFDLTSENNNRVMGYLVSNGDSSVPYDLYIVSKGLIYANEDSSLLFSFPKVQTITGLDNIDFSNTVIMKGMFYSNTLLEELDVSSFDTDNVTNMSYLFYSCSKLNELDLSSFNTSNVIDISNMFNGCKKITSLDLSNFDTSNVLDMSFLFNICSKLTSVDVSSFNTINVVNMKSMFNGCNSLKSLDVSKFDTSNVTSMYNMFNGCYLLKSLDLSNFDTSNVTNMLGMFRECRKLEKLDLSNFNTTNVTNMSLMFFNCKALEELIISSFNTNNVLDMSNMFAGCLILPNLNVSSFNTSNVTNMANMFSGCRKLEKLDLSNFNTSKVTKMYGMFAECFSLKTLDLSSFDTSNVTNFGVGRKITCGDVISYTNSAFSGMFYDCKGLESINLSSFDTSKAETMGDMFANCSALKSLDLSGFDTSNVTSMTGMFSGINMNILDLSNFNTSKVEDLTAMFSESSISDLELSNWDYSNVDNISCMFWKSDISSYVNAKTLNANNYNNMFLFAARDDNNSIYVDYSLENEDLIELMIATKSSDSNVFKADK